MTIQTITEMAVIFFDIDFNKLIEKGRVRQYSDIRSIIYYVARIRGHSAIDIGNYFNRDRTTVVSGCKNVVNVSDIEKKKNKFVNFLDFKPDDVLVRRYDYLQAVKRILENDLKLINQMSSLLKKRLIELEDSEI